MELSLSGASNKRAGWLMAAPLIIMVLTAFLYFGGIITVRQEKDALGYAHEAVLGGLGAGLFVHGFLGLRKKKLIEDTPASKIRSVAMGLAEVAGTARQKYPLATPLSGAQCVYYRFLVEQEKRGSKGRKYWAKVRDGISAAYFYVEDETGRLLVDPLDAEGVLIRDYYVTEASGGFLGGRMRYSEWYILPGDHVYVLGSVRKFRDAGLSRKERLAERLRQIKQDAEKMKALDLDSDGRVSAEEWDLARQKAEEELFQEELKNPPAQDEDLVIAQGDIEKTFILSDRDEKDVARHLGLRCFFSAGGGAVLLLGMAVSLLARTGLLPRGFAIPWEMFYH